MGEWDPEPSESDRLRLGHRDPGELAAPIVRYRNGDAKKPESFVGTATLIGAGFFLTARHVLDGTLRTAPLDHDEWLGLIRLVPIHREEQYIQAINRIQDWEFHPDPRADLAIGRTNSSFRKPYYGIEPVSEGLEVNCIGFPKDLHVAGASSQDSWVEGRFLKGHVTRRLQPGAFGVTAPSVELSFVPTEGMSGAPIYHRHHERMLGLVGVAVRTAIERVPAPYLEVLLDDEDEPPRTIMKIVEYGVALRLTAVARWRVALAGGAELGALIGSAASLD